MKSTKQAGKDKIAVSKLLTIHQVNPYYGVARFALELNWTEKKARRIRNLAGITASKRIKKRKTKSFKPEVQAPGNALKRYIDFKDSARAQNFETYL